MSDVDPSVPTAVDAYTAPVRANFLAIKNEIDSLEAAHALKLLEQKGAVFSGAGSATADTAAIQALIDEYEALSGFADRRARLRLPHPDELGSSTGKIHLNAGLTINLSGCGGLMGNGNVLDFSAAADGTTYITVTGSVAAGANLYSQARARISDFAIIGNGEAGTSTAFAFPQGSGGQYSGGSYCSLENIYITTTGTCFDFAAVWLVKARKIDMISCNVGAVLNAYGEIMAFSDSTFANGFKLLEMNADSGQFIWQNGSIDYNSGPLVVATQGRINFINSNIEGNSENGQPWFDLNLDGTAGVLRFNNCDFLCAIASSPHNVPALWDVEANWTVHADNCFFDNWRNTANVLAVGPGRVFVRGYRSYNASLRPALVHDDNTAANMLMDGDFETAAVNESDPTLTVLYDDWCISGDSSAITHRYDGATLNVLVSNDQAVNGTNTLAIQMIGGTVSDATRRLSLYKPVNPGSQYVLKFYHRSSAGSGTFYVAARWLTRFDVVNDLVVAVGETSNFYTNSAITPSSSAWTTSVIPFNNVLPWTAPDWAHGIEIMFGLGLINNASGYLYLDFVWLQEWSGR